MFNDVCALANDRSEWTVAGAQAKALGAPCHARDASAVAGLFGDPGILKSGLGDQGHLGGPRAGAISYQV